MSKCKHKWRYPGIDGRSKFTVRVCKLCGALSQSEKIVWGEAFTFDTDDSPKPQEPK